MTPDLSAENFKSSPGTVEFGYLKGIELSDGTKVGIPIISVNGKNPGKTLFLISTLHGQEITGIEIIRQICREIVDPNVLNGRIVAIPIGNPLAFYSSSYHTIRYDYQDLNRCFPGDPNGSTTVRIASMLWQVASKCDYLIDLHCIPQAMGDGYSIVRPIGTDFVNKECFEMAEAFGLTISVSKPKNVDESVLQPGLQACAVSAGIPSLLLELSDWRRITRTTVEAGVKGVLNILKRFGMINGNLEAQSGKVLQTRLIQSMIFSSSGGILHPIAELGDALKRGDKVARILDPFGDEKETITAPNDSYLLAYPQTENQAIATGEYVALLGNEES
jgi:predicted deacylase